jgi:D-amino peptidase
MLRKALGVSAILVALSLSLQGQGRKLKVYISVDMEGVAGVVTTDQLGPASFEYPKFREFMTRETLSAVQAAKEAGATEILVSDSHGNMENLLIDMFPPDVRLIRGAPRHLSMMAGIDRTFDAVIFIGYHASTNNVRGVRAHTFSSARLTRVALNGTVVTEGAFNAAIAGHFGVPVVMISGDDAAVAEVRSLVGNIEGFETKRTLGFHSANNLTPEASIAGIAQKVKAALARRAELRPYVVRAPITLDVSFKNYMPAEVLSYLKVVQRVDSHSIRYVGQDMVEVSDFMDFVDSYNIGLEP